MKIYLRKILIVLNEDNCTANKIILQPILRVDSNKLVALVLLNPEVPLHETESDAMHIK